MSPHPLAGPFSVEASAQRIRHYRYVEERMMRTLGGWIALTPELPVKLLFGRHVWDCAQHADQWGRRLLELRASAQTSEPANDRFVRFVDLLDAREAPGESLERVVGVYRVLKPHLVATYAEHLAGANVIYEPPTRRVLERCLDEERRHVAAGARVLERLARGAGLERARACEERLMTALATAGGLAGDTPAPQRALEVLPGVDPARDLVALDSTFGAAVLDVDLATAVAAHARGLIAGDWDALEVQFAEPARSRARELYRRLIPVAAAEVVGQAKIGAYRIVKVRLAKPQGGWLLQLEWRRVDGGWQVVRADVVP